MRGCLISTCAEAQGQYKPLIVTTDTSEPTNQPTAQPARPRLGVRPCGRMRRRARLPWLSVFKPSATVARTSTHARWGTSSRRRGECKVPTLLPLLYKPLCRAVKAAIGTA